MIKLLKIYKELPTQVKASLWFILCNVFQKGIVLITTPIFTRMLTTEQYGVVNVYNSWSSLLTIFFTLNLSYGVFNKGLIQYEDNRDTFTSTIQGLSTTVSIILIGVYFIFRDVINMYTGLSTFLMIVMFVEMLLYPALGFWSARQRFEYKYIKLVIVTLLLTVLNAFLGVIAVQAIDVYKAEARIATSVIVVAIVCGSIYLQNLLKGKKFFSKQVWLYALAFNIPLIPHYLSQAVLNQSDRIMIDLFVGSHAAGIYGVAYSAGMLLTIFNSALIGSITPWIYNLIKAKRFSGIAQKINVILILVFLIVLILILFAPEAIKVLATKEYYEAIYIVPPVAASVYFMFLYNVVCLIEFYFEKTKLVLIASVSGALINIGLNIYFIPTFGYIAAGYTTLASYILMSVMHYIFADRIQAKEKIYPKLVDKKLPITLSLILVLFSILINFSYDNYILRYTVIILILIILMKKRKYIQMHIKELKK
ncbi:lipopolysaccharide biosynthesis protein [Priestia aryabhattai]|uniref:lipopolysaccharide biosynthesis protein n=1 Tax=Priestia aryabhattai TaxID=412384 RepID=UPI00366AF747